jgi:4'-phosphopantetheinyl transferase
MTAGITIGAGDVHVWQTTSTPDDVDADAAWKLLTIEERAMARRLRDDDDRARRVQARAARRRLLARYVGTEPEALRFCDGTDGKPELVGPPDRPSVRFNVSHSGSVILIAVAGDREVGIDVERIQTRFPWEQVAGSAFSPAELESIRGSSEDRRVRAFFDCWVRKEAYLKGLGQGLVRSTRDFDVPLGPDGGAVHDLSRDGVERSDWRVHPIAVGPGYAAALAVEGDVRVTCSALTALTS